jgi:Ulp1 family protease
MENHWSMMVVNINKLKMEYFDSKNNDGHGVKSFKILKCFFDDLISINSKKNNYDWCISLWNSQPIQDNNYDCGVFLCKFIECFSLNQHFDFNEKDIPYLRLLIGIELIKGKMLN